METADMYRPSKGALIGLLALILAVAVIVICMPGSSADDLNADLTVAVNADLFIGSIGVSCVRGDGSSGSGGVVNADGTPFIRGDVIPLEADGWPVTVSVYADIQGAVLLAYCTIKEMPPEGCFWQVSVREGNGSIVLDPVMRLKEGG